MTVLAVIMGVLIASTMLALLVGKLFEEEVRSDD